MTNRRGRSLTLAAAAANRKRARIRLKPELAQLEDRHLLATFTVTSPLDTETDGVPATGTLRWAVEQANLAGGTDVIDFSTTVFNTPQTITFGTGNGAIPMTTAAATITIDGPGSGLLTVDGNNDGEVLQIGSGVAATISGMTITGGSSSGNSDLYGAIDDLGSVTLTDCIVTGNTISGLYVTGTADISDCTIVGNSSFTGGGVYVKGGSVTITGSTLSGNSCVDGGGLWSNGTATLIECTVSGNSAFANGGGVYNSGGLTVKDCTFSGDLNDDILNQAGTAKLIGSTISDGSLTISGGNLRNVYGATLTVTDCTISGGSADSGGGLDNGGMATLTDCTISDNTTSGTGAGIQNESNAILIMSGCTLVGNTSPQSGGGLMNSGTATLSDDTIANNFGATFGGGGVDNGGIATLVACTISDNTTTESGGGIYEAGDGPFPMTLYDTIVADNVSTQTGSAFENDISDGAVDVLGSCNLIGPGGSGGLVNGDSGNIVLTSLAGLNLAPLADNGGPTQTMALLPGSPAIEAGENESGVTADQRGQPLDFPFPDIGAYQTQTGHAAPLVYIVTSTLDNDSSGTLRWAVSQVNSTTRAATIEWRLGASPATITLSQGQLELTNTGGMTTIEGPAAGVAVSGDGAGRVLQVDSGVTASISGLTITQGSAASGGGLYSQGVTQLTDCTIAGNSATGVGGGLFNTGTMTLTNCTLAGNGAAGGAGLANSGTAILYACTITGNAAAVGGGIDNLAGAVATLEDTLIAGNVSAANSPSDIGGSDAAGVTGTFDLVGTGGAGGINGAGDIVLTSLAGLLLAPMSNYGGPDATIALLPGCSAIGAGTGMSDVDTDERGEPLDSPSPDIGAFQTEGFILTPTTGSTPQTTDIGTAFTDPLALNVTANNSSDPVAGGVVTFTVNPAASGAGASLSAASAIIQSNGIVQVTATAGSIAGSYTVTASAGATASNELDLTNLIGTSFSGLVDQTMTYGTPSVTVAGTLAAESGAPPTGTVEVTLGDDTQPATLGSEGNFSITFTDTGSLTVNDSPYAIGVTYDGVGLLAPASASSSLTVTQTASQVSVTDSSGTFSGLPYRATYRVTGLTGVPASSLEGVKVSASYYSGTYSSASQLAGLTALTSTPIGAGAYTVLASFPGSADYMGNAAVADFAISQAVPVVNVSDAGGSYNGTAFAATDSVLGVGGAGGENLEGVGVSLVYYSGTYTTATQLVGLGALSAAPSGAGAYTVLATYLGAADYSSSSALANFEIQQSTPEVSVVDNSGAYTGSAFAATAGLTGINGLPELTLEGIGLVLSYYNGTYTSAAELGGLEALSGAPSELGSYTVLASFAGSADYSPATELGNFTITQGMPQLAWSDPTSIVYGSALRAAQLDASANVPGRFSYSPATGAILNAGTNQTLSVTFTPEDSIDYAAVATTASITVEQAEPTLKLDDLGGEYDGSPFPASVMIEGAGGNNSFAPSLEGVSPTVAYYSGTGTTGHLLGNTPPSAIGIYTVVASFAGTPDYAAAMSAPVTFTITGARATISLTSSSASAVYGEPITFAATVAAAGAPSGSVTFFDNGRALATVALDSSGTAELTTSSLDAGSHSIVVTYSGNAVVQAAQSGVAPESIARSSTTIALVPHPVVKKRTVKSEVLTAQIHPVAPGGGFPTGTATFELVTKKKKKTKTTVLGVANVTAGAATLAFKPKRVLGKVLTIIYSGVPDFTSSTLTAPKLTKKGLL